MMKNFSSNDPAVQQAMILAHQKGSPCPKENVIAGNTCLYGATGGEAPDTIPLVMSTVGYGKWP